MRNASTDVRDPPAQFAPVESLPERQKPASHSYYTGRPAYIDTLLALEDFTRETKRALEQSHHLARNVSPSSASAGHVRNVWLTLEGLRAHLGVPLKTAQYRQIMVRLSALARYRVAARALPALSARIEELLGRFTRPNAEAVLQGPKERGLDELGRAYAVGRRKESSARVWIIPTKEAAPADAVAAGADASSGAVATTASSSTAAPGSLVSQVLLNGRAIHEHFTRNSDREAALWPLKLGGVLGAYNVFALVRGGGTSGQAGAIAHGLANALAIIRPELRDTLFKGESKDIVCGTTHVVRRSCFMGQGTVAPRRTIRAALPAWVPSELPLRNYFFY